MKSVLTAILLAIPFSLAIPEWGQCGGQNWTGGTCDAGLTCVYQNPYYSQCLRTGSGGGATTTRTSSQTTPTNTSGNLSARFRAKGKRYWGTCSDSALLSNSQNAAVIRAQFNQLTAENSMKWDATERSQNSFSYSGGDTLVNFARSNGMLVRGHTYVWHAQLPSWVSSITSSSTLTNVIRNHIANLGARWRGSVYAWDVCNEILNENGSLRSSVFYNVLGDSFVGIAFHAARSADGSSKLYINDYNLDSVNSKVNGMVSRVRTWRSQGVPIDGIGTQAHLGAGGAGGVQAALSALAGTGVPEVAITELDIANAGSNDYVTVTRACLAVSTCVGITSWGVRDADSWRTGANPLLFDNNYQPKAAWTAVMNALA